MSTAPVDTLVDVDTPEHLVFRIAIAGPMRRLFARLIDLVVQAILVLGIGLFASLVFGVAGLGGVGAGVLLVAIFVVDWFYFVLAELLTGGRSVGKMALSLRVVRTNGLPITWQESLLRNLLRSADVVIMPPFVFPLAPIVMLVDPRCRRAGDLAAGTIVVVEEPARVEDPSTKAPDPKILATLPPVLPLSVQELEGIEMFVHRTRMSADRCDELAAMVAPHFARRLGLDVPQSPAAFLFALWARAQEPKKKGQA